MKILWLSTRWPFPPDDGAKQATHSLLLSLAELGHEIDVVTFARENAIAASPHNGIRLLAHFKAAPLSLGSRIAQVARNLGEDLPVSASPFARFDLSWEKLRGLLRKDPDGVVFDGPHSFAGFKNQSCPWPLLYRAHNVETDLWESAISSRPLFFRPYFSLQTRRMRRFEEALAKAAQGIAAISLKDGREFNRWLPMKRIEIVPMGFRFSSPPALPSGQLTLGYLGRLDWPPNREGLAWFLREIWPEVVKQRPEIRLRIAGSGDASWLVNHFPRNFEWLGRIDSIEDFYAGIHAALAPIPFGGGTKIKVVEAARFGRSLLTTHAAMDGSGLSRGAMALVSDHAKDWIETLLALDPSELSGKGQQAFTEASSAFDSTEAAARFLSLFS